jgi:hypothetical protein
LAHFARIKDGIVDFVTVGRDDDENREDELAHDGWIYKRTSYNTRGGVHASGGTPFRKNYAGIGYTYDAGRDAFIPPKPYNSWVLNETPASGMRLLPCLLMLVRVSHLKDTHGMKRP